MNRRMVGFWFFVVVFVIEAPALAKLRKDVYASPAVEYCANLIHRAQDMIECINTVRGHEFQSEAVSICAKNYDYNAYNFGPTTGSRCLSVIQDKRFDMANLRSCSRTNKKDMLSAIDCLKKQPTEKILPKTPSEKQPTEWISSSKEICDSLFEKYSTEERCKRYRPDNLNCKRNCVKALAGIQVTATSVDYCSYFGAHENLHMVDCVRVFDKKSILEDFLPVCNEMLAQGGVELKQCSEALAVKAQKNGTGRTKRAYEANTSDEGAHGAR